MDIVVYNGDDRTVSGILSEYDTMKVSRGYNEVGKMELNLSVTEGSQALTLAPGMWLWPQGYNEIYIVETVKRRSEGILYVVEIEGYTASVLLDRRVISIEKYRSGTIGAILNGVFADEMATERRQFPGLTIDIDAGLGDTTTYETQLITLLETVRRLCALSGLGFRTVFDENERGMTFQLYTGNNHTMGNGNGVIVLMDVLFGTIQESDTLESIKGFANYGYAYGEMDYQNNVQKRAQYDASDGASGYDLFETVILYDRRSKTDSYTMTANEYTQAMVDYTRQTLRRMKKRLTITGTLYYDGGIYVLDKDYAIGDRVTVQDEKWGLQFDGILTVVRDSVTFGLRKTQITIVQ